MISWRTGSVDLDLPILPNSLQKIGDGYNHFICVCSPNEVDYYIKLYSDDVKLIVLADSFDPKLEYLAIVCYSKNQVYNYINTPTSTLDARKRYTFLGCRGLRKYWLHVKLRSWSFVREQKTVDYYRFEYTGIKHIDIQTCLVVTDLKTPVDSKSLCNLYKNNLHRIGPFVPNTHDIRTFKCDPGKVYIVKPIIGSSGDGVTVVSNSIELEIAKSNIGKRRGIVCDYIRSPKLFKGKKFHLRCYFMVTTWGEFHLYHRAKIITAKLPYIDNFYLNRGIHDTHIKSTDNNYFYPDDMPGCDYFLQIRAICDRLATVVSPLSYFEASRSYEILGIDILIDKYDKAWLLEVNSSPGMKPVNDDYLEYDQFEREILQWEYDHAINI